jgi:hypothetical protein
MLMLLVRTEVGGVGLMHSSIRAIDPRRLAKGRKPITLHASSKTPSLETAEAEAKRLRERAANIVD